MGNVTGTIARSPISRECFNWTIPRFAALPRLYDTSIESDWFPVADTKWILALRWKFNSVELELRRDSGPVVSPLPVRVGIVGANGSRHFCRWGATDRDGVFVCSDFLFLDVVEQRNEEIAPNGTLTVFCEIHKEVVEEASTQTEPGTLIKAPTQTEASSQQESATQTVTATQIEAPNQAEASFQQESATQAVTATQIETATQMVVPIQLDKATQTESALELKIATQAKASTQKQASGQEKAATQSEASTVPKPSSHIHELQLDYENLLQTAEGSDVSLRVSGRNFRAHRYILGARSKVFSCMFRHDMSEAATGIVDIDDLQPDCFENFLQYVYAGRVNGLSEENVYDLYRAADKYDVQGLKSVCLEYMKRTLSADTFCDVMALALRHQEEELLRLAYDFFPNNLEEVIVTVSWQSFYKHHYSEANELLIKALVPGNKRKRLS